VTGKQQHVRMGPASEAAVAAAAQLTAVALDQAALAVRDLWSGGSFFLSTDVYSNERIIIVVSTVTAARFYSTCRIRRKSM
jgi:hypothetical protein